MRRDFLWDWPVKPKSFAGEAEETLGTPVMVVGSLLQFWSVYLQKGTCYPL